MDKKAFPVHPIAHDRSDAECDALSGMSLRDYFAAKALLALLDEPQWSDSTPGMTARVLGMYHGLQPQDAYARAAYMFADAMLKARTA